MRLTPEQRTEALRRLANREAFEDIAKALGVPRVTISKLGLYALYTGEIVLS